MSNNIIFLVLLFLVVATNFVIVFFIRKHPEKISGFKLEGSENEIVEKLNWVNLLCRMIVIGNILTLIGGMSRYQGNRQQEVSEISRALKTLALELKVPVLCLAQLSRTPELREDKRPILSDLRESGSIEQDADIVGFIYRDDYYNKDSKIDDNLSKAELIVRKNRSGKIGTADLLFKKNTASFMNYKKEKEGE